MCRKKVRAMIGIMYRREKEYYATMRGRIDERFAKAREEGYDPDTHFKELKKLMSMGG